MNQNNNHLWHKYILLAGFVLSGFLLAAQPIVKREQVIVPDTTHIDSLTNIMRRAVQLDDSIRIAKRSARFDQTNQAIIDGRPALWVFKVDINRIFHYNRYQGLYLGLGLHTGDRLSKLFSVGGYWGYGFGSKSAAYGVDGILLIDRQSDTRLKLELSHDFTESGGLPDYGEVKRLLDASGFYKLLVRRMDLMDLRQVTVSARPLRYLRAGISLFQSVKTPTYDYAYVIGQQNSITVLDNQFHFSGLSINLRYAFGEGLAREPGSAKPLAAAYPVVKMQITRGIAGWFDGQYSFERYDLQVEQTFQTENLGSTSLVLQAGIASGDLPYCNLFSGRGGYGRFTIYAPQSFATMRQNEFVSDRYASLYFTQNFGKVLPRSRHFNPEIAWCASAGFGDLSQPEKHRYIDIRTLTRGYFESGLLVNNLLNLKVYNLGFGAFYRLGPYAFPAFSDNIALKFSVNIPF